MKFNLDASIIENSVVVVVSVVWEGGGLGINEKIK